MGGGGEGAEARKPAHYVHITQGYTTFSMLPWLLLMIHSALARRAVRLSRGADFNFCTRLASEDLFPCDCPCSVGGASSDSKASGNKCWKRNVVALVLTVFRN